MFVLELIIFLIYITEISDLGFLLQEEILSLE